MNLPRHRHSQGGQEACPLLFEKSPMIKIKRTKLYMLSVSVFQVAWAPQINFYHPMLMYIQEKFRIFVLKVAT